MTDDRLKELGGGIGILGQHHRGADRGIKRKLDYVFLYDTLNPLPDFGFRGLTTSHQTVCITEKTDRHQKTSPDHGS